MARFLRCPIAGHRVPRRGSNFALVHIKSVETTSTYRVTWMVAMLVAASIAVTRATRKMLFCALRVVNARFCSRPATTHNDQLVQRPILPRKAPAIDSENKVSSSPSSPPHSDGHRGIAFLTQNQHFYFQQLTTVPTHLGRQTASG
jgi:hypothetical protein